MIGETVGGYRLLGKLGEGGMGAVYLAEHKYIARRAAIKFLLPELAGSGEVASRFFSEARSASLIQHPGIVEVLDCDVHRDGRAFIVMELLEGENLRSYIERNGKREDDPGGALAICWQMASALAAAHGQNIIHRDLKPENVFLHVRAGQSPFEPTVKLLDFGIAKLQIAGGGATKTRTGQLLGTPLYMSPEQCRGSRQVDARSDIYSLGCIMFEVFCGQPPFVAEGFGDLIVAHVSQAPPDPRAFAPRMTTGLHHLLARCLEKEPAARPASVAEVAALLAAEGAAQAVRLNRPVIATAPLAPAERAVAPTMKTPGGQPSFVPPRAVVPPPSMAASRVPTPLPAGGTRVLPSFRATTLGAGASEIVLHSGARRSWKKIGVVAAFMVAGGATISIFGLARRTMTVSPIVETPAAATAATARDRARERPTVEPAVAPAVEPPVDGPVSVTLTGIPSQGVIRLDGDVVSTPLVIPGGTKQHRLTVDADGFDRWVGSVDGKTDRTIHVSLSPTNTNTNTKTAVARPKPKRKKIKDQNDLGNFTGFSDL